MPKMQLNDSLHGDPIIAILVPITDDSGRLLALDSPIAQQDRLAAEVHSLRS
jgi:hypothetical protein